jgi:hypothetical protein
MIQYNVHKKKLELWTNSDKSEFAIYLKNNSDKINKNASRDTNYKLLVVTSHNRNIEYTELLDESDYLEDLQYNWKYTLEQWIDNHKNKHLITIAEPLLSLHPILSHIEDTITKDQVQENQNNISSNNTDYQEGLEVDREEKEEESANNKINIHRNLRKYKITAKGKKSNLKCHFCKLEYLTNKQRTEHEHAWHLNNNKFVM